MNEQTEQAQESREPEKMALDKRLDALGWGLFLIMIGGLWLAPEGWVPEGTWLIGTGIIILGLMLFFPLYIESQEYDPVCVDAPEYDKKFPPAMLEAPEDLMSNGKRLNGIIYLAQGQGPHPTVLLLHGLPGNERNLDLAQREMPEVIDLCVFGNGIH